RDLAVDRLVLARGLLPGELRRALEPAPDEVVGVREHLLDRRGDLLDRVRIEQSRGVAADLGWGGGVRRRAGAAARHRLERRLAEALVQAREAGRGRVRGEAHTLGR